MKNATYNGNKAVDISFCLGDAEEEQATLSYDCGYVYLIHTTLNEGRWARFPLQTLRQQLEEGTLRMNNVFCKYARAWELDPEKLVRIIFNNAPANSRKQEVTA